MPSGFTQYPGLLNQTKVKKNITHKNTQSYAAIHGAYLTKKIQDKI